MAIVTVKCEGELAHNLPKFLMHLDAIASGGHGYEVIADKGDLEYEKTMYIDGDGSDRLEIISVEADDGTDITDEYVVDYNEYMRELEKEGERKQAEQKKNEVTAGGQGMYGDPLLHPVYDPMGFGITQTESQDYYDEFANNGDNALWPTHRDGGSLDPLAHPTQAEGPDNLVSMDDIRAAAEAVIEEGAGI